MDDFEKSVSEKHITARGRGKRGTIPSFLRVTETGCFPESNIKKNDNERWHYILSAFDPIKNVTKISRPLTACCNAKHKNKQHTLTLGSRLSNNKSENRGLNTSQIHIKVGRPNNLQMKKCVGKIDKYSEIVCTRKMHDDSDNGLENLFSQLSDSSKMKQTLASQIVRSSSNDSEQSADSNLGNNNRASICENSEKILDPKYELSLFINLIEEDRQRTNKVKKNSTVKKHVTVKKNCYLHKFRMAISKARGDIRFLRYEQQAEIVRGQCGVISERNISYGLCVAYVRFQNVSHCYLVLDKSMHSMKIKSNLVSFVDNAKYSSNGLDVHIQPNKVLNY